MWGAFRTHAHRETRLYAKKKKCGWRFFLLSNVCAEKIQTRTHEKEAGRRAVNSGILTRLTYIRAPVALISDLETKEKLHKSSIQKLEFLL